MAARALVMERAEGQDQFIVTGINTTDLVFFIYSTADMNVVPLGQLWTTCVESNGKTVSTSIELDFFKIKNHFIPPHNNRLHILIYFIK